MILKLLKYSISPNTIAFSTYRGEGVGCYGGFNITPYCGDATEHVATCRKKLCEQLGIDDRQLILPYQTHSDKVAIIDDGFMRLDEREQKEVLKGVDAIITALPRACIGVSTADCIPVLLHDTKLNVIAAIHAGWRGTVARIVEKTTTAMELHYGCCADDIKAVIAPGISIDAFEVGDEVYATFAEAGFPMRRIAKRYPAGQGEKWHIDLWEANRLQMVAAGIKAENITIAGICTYTRHEDFFSARRLGINSGRLFNGIMLR
jgi:YfiH family protein